MSTSQVQGYPTNLPRSAVDAHVQEHIFTHVLSKSTGIKKDATVILVTNALQFLNRMDHVIAMDAGIITAQGSPSQVAGLLEDLSSLLSNMALNDESTEETHETKKQKAKLGGGMGSLILKEHRARETVDKKTYLAFFRSFGLVSAVSIFVSIFLDRSLNVGTTFWLSFWAGETTKQKLLGQDETQSAFDQQWYYVSVYAALTGGALVMLLIRALLMAYGRVRASKQIFDDLLDHVMGTTVDFFDTTPTGRKWNAFQSKFCLDPNFFFFFSLNT